MALDGTGANYASSGSSIAASLTTAGSGLIFALIVLNGTTVSTVTASGLTFTKRAENLSSYISLWEATSSSAQSSLTITANLAGSASFSTLHLWGYSGYSGLDSDGSNPQAAGSSPLTISTSSTSTVIMSGARPTGGGNNNPGSGFTQILGATGGGFTLSQYAEFATPQTNLLVHDEGTVDTSNGSVAVAYVLSGGGFTAVNRRTLGPRVGSRQR